MKQLRIAHISDIHFSQITFSPAQFLSKRFLGNFNLIACRKKEYQPEKLQHFTQLLLDKEITHVIIAGDLSTTSREAEFRIAKRYVEDLQSKGLQVICIPGNHDSYTWNAHRTRRFYSYFPSRYSECSMNLRDDCVTALKLDHGYTLVLLDTTLSTSYVWSRGLFSERIEANLKKLLKEIPKDEKLIFVNHFPFFQHVSPRKKLVRGDILEKILLDEPRAALYLNGHTHIHAIADLRSSGYPIVLDSGSIARKLHSSWNLIDLNEKGGSIEAYRSPSKSYEHWKKFRDGTFIW